MFNFVDTLSTNWNQIESYIFEAYEAIKGLQAAEI